MIKVGTPAPEVDIDVSLVYRLLADQQPDLAHLPIHLTDSGWDNAMYRLGEQWCVRLPRRQLAAQLIEHEQIWLPKLADRLPIPVPTPYRLGIPADDYPWRWSIVPWIAGFAADQEALHANQAKRFGAFLRSLHVPAPANAPHNPARGVPLSQRAAAVEERMQRLAAKTNLMTSTIQQIWQHALTAPMDLPALWLHGDLHPRNILVKDGVISGVIDWGDVTCGDIATDLASLWMLFPESRVRQCAIAAYHPVSAATLQRAKGWAVLFGVILLDTGLVDNPRNAVMGDRILRCVAEDS
jgi:aminoglycoside phosphotransferase (APT) family kinase protein